MLVETERAAVLELKVPSSVGRTSTLRAFWREMEMTGLTVSLTLLENQERKEANASN